MKKNQILFRFSFLNIYRYIPKEITLISCGCILAIFGFIYSTNIINTFPHPNLSLITMHTNSFFFVISIACIVIGCIIAIKKMLLPREVHYFAIGYIILNFVIMHFSTNGFFLQPDFGRHWILQADALFHGSISLGSLNDLGGVVIDTAIKDGFDYLPYPIGGAIFSIVFIGYFKIASVFLYTIICYLFVYLAKYVGRVRTELVDIFIICGIIFLLPIQMSGTFYPISQTGVSIFIALTFICFTKYQKEKNELFLVIGTFLIFLGSLFRFEIMVCLIIPFSLMFYYYGFNFKKFLRSKVFLTNVILSLFSGFVFCIQNYLKFDDPFNSGIGYNHMINDPTMKGLSTKFFPERFIDFFVDLPFLDFSGPIYKILSFPFQGSEPGGYFFVRYPYAVLFIIISLLNLIIYINQRKQFKAIFLKSTISKLISKKYIIPVFSKDYFTKSITPFFGGLILMGIFLFGFNTSPRYHAIFVPLFAVSFFFYYPKRTLFRLIMLTITIIVNASIYMNFFYVYPNQF